ncbi:hypothetical protein ACS0TY_002328 [Phlomoides rotata]
MSLLHFFSLYASLIFTPSPTVNSLQKIPDDRCASKCGTLQIPFPFYPPLSDAFCLSCVNSSSLFITLSSQSYRLLHFFPDGVLVDFPNTTATCRQYNDLKSFSFSANQFFGISSDNVLDLYDCEDSSLCKPDCETTSLMPGCDRQGSRGYPSCCYPLSDHSSWRPGDSFTKFSQYGCRGFSSWVTFPGNTTGKRGVKLEWGVPGNSTEPTCAAAANAVNATSVTSGIRCQCPDGFSGDGFSAGVGCLKCLLLFEQSSCFRNISLTACFKDGKEVQGNDCYRSKHGKKKAIILGVITSTIAVVSFTALYLLKRSIRSDKFVPDKSRCQTVISSHKVSRSRLFTYHELEEATKGFGDAQKIIDSPSTTLYAGVLTGGSRVAIQKVQCESDSNLIRLLFRLETLSAVSHKNMAHIIGWCIESGSGALVVYEYPGNRTFKEHLCQSRDHDGSTTTPLDWYKRLNIAAEIASLLAVLHHEISPPIFHHGLQTGCMFVDMDYSVKLAGFELHIDEGSECDSRRNDVYTFGLVLLEIITGNTNCSETGALQKIKKGKVEEIVDPSLYYHEQAAYWREQIEVIADLATRCLLFGGDGKLSMFDVAKELVHMNKDARRGPALEETFSNSSLLQMISMSPDSIYTTNLN